MSDREPTIYRDPGLDTLALEDRVVRLENQVAELIARLFQRDKHFEDIRRAYIGRRA